MFVRARFVVATTSKIVPEFGPEWGHCHIYFNLTQCHILNNPHKLPKEEEEEEEENLEIIQINEDDILAEHVCFCKVYGKGFRQDGNVCIHMGSHENQYKTLEELKSNRPKATKSYFSCPIEDCKLKWGHHNFKPLKSMVCLRNHYKKIDF